MENQSDFEPCANLDNFSDMKNKKWAIMIRSNHYRGVTSSFWDAVLKFSV